MVNNAAIRNVNDDGATVPPQLSDPILKEAELWQRVRQTSSRACGSRKLLSIVGIAAVAGLWVLSPEVSRAQIPETSDQQIIESSAPATAPIPSDFTPTQPSVPTPSEATTAEKQNTQQSSTQTAVVTGLVGGISAIVGVAITQFGAFRLSRRQRRGDRVIAQLDELRESIHTLDTAYADAQSSDFATADSRALDGAIRKYDRAWRMVNDADVRRLAPLYHETLRSFTVEAGDLEVESPTTRIDVERSSNELIDRIRKALTAVD
ncbi:hypothetical protein [Rhodococcus qingshengii]|uniref:hypothetical protein n=1 Tax=Rhodococcus qingshengii TaxID=334542 RepID=UPI001E2E42A0|nr:hypothetical protein [Rhodococcus qingshengii]UDF20131.1 hypothetical protein LE551_23035 [Rhodococcus qingshengii]